MDLDVIRPRLKDARQEAARRMEISQPKVSDLMNGDRSNLFERKLIDCLNRPGYDVEIKVKPASALLSSDADDGFDDLADDTKHLILFGLYRQAHALLALVD